MIKRIFKYKLFYFGVIVESIRFILNLYITLYNLFSNSMIFGVDVWLNFVVWGMGIYGFWIFKRWSIIVFTAVQVLFLYSSFAMGVFNIFNFLIPLYVIIMSFVYRKEMN
ncbi:hypothetical protein OF820_07160 [Oceanotoga sp. DSM 15011]|uniref:hypothetical protein n=1 Tax=unclassified Oceanotoga TaxID=2618448 RepID=UPI0021F4E64A|nr:MULTISPECIES: hypothetical protein [unclassified Oceanotoga]MDN5341712.1 hypothetical protein [Oceanotoga sp.]UYO98852.1 hypothetical protein OF820_07160 [Oceanotoga sp. DSM 15011]